jgi:hypothetical protein
MSDHQLTPDKLIICRAIDLITGVSQAVVDRCRRPSNTSNVTVSARDLVALVDAIEAEYPGLIEKLRSGEESL